MSISRSFILISLATTLLCACGSSVEVMEGIRFNSTRFRSMANQEGSQALLRMADGGFTACQFFSQSEARIERFDGDLGVRWATPIGVAHRGERMDLGYGGDLQASEAPVVFYRSDRNFILITHRAGAGDSIYAIGRVFDAETGKEIATRTLLASAGDKRIKRYGRFSASFSPDSSALLLYVCGLEPATGSFKIDYGVVGPDLSPISSATLPFPAFRDVESLVTMRVDNDKNVYTIARYYGDTLRLVRTKGGTMGESDTIRTAVKSLEASSCDIDDIGIIFDDPHTIVASLPYSVDNALNGFAFVRIDTRSGITTARYELVPRTAFESVDNLDLHAPPGNTFYRVDLPGVRYIRILERRSVDDNAFSKGFSISRMSRKSIPLYDLSYTEKIVGDVLIVGLDENGRLQWHNGFEKETSTKEVPHRFIAMACHVDNEMVRIIGRDGRSMVHHTYRTVDGKEIGTFRRLLHMSGSAYFDSNCTNWLADGTLLTSIRLGVNDAEYHLYRLSIDGK